ncbi:helix-turn-helix transcriptional regulator [Limimaricola sp.]|uniref:helix-turn-helix transcriptional regulator n=1 Tax=Limimaricola sp. TaxID=2211665 RepID=UPI00405994F1
MLDEIYRGAIAPELWAALPERIAALAGGGAWALQFVQPGQPRRAEWHGCNFDPALAALYSKRFAAMDPWLDHALQMPELRLVCGDLLLRKDGFFDSAFYTEFLRPQGDIYHSFGTVLLRGDSGSLVLSCNHAPLQAETAGRSGPRLLLQLAPHLRRAVDLMRGARHDAMRRAAWLFDGLDMQQACLLVDRRGRVVARDSRGAALLAKGTLLRQGADGQLRFSDKAAHALFDRALAQGGRPTASFALPGRCCAPRLARLVALPDDELIAPLKALLADERAVAALIVMEPGPSDRLDADLSRLYALTQAEMLVLRLLCEGHAMPEIAARRGVSVNTVRNQLRSLFDKTGTRRQAELVALATRLGG